MKPRPSMSGLQQVGDIERRLAEEFVGALVFQHQQLALDRANAGGRDIAVALLQVGGVFRDIAENGAQILEVEQGKALFVGDAEGDVEHAFLDVVEFEDARQQQRPHFRDGGAHRMAVLAENVPEHAAELVGLIVDADFLRLGDQRRGAPSPGMAMPDRSPLTSAAKTQVPAAQKPSASLCRVTVLPVPVAPATRPWRLP